ncbi:hypothetical protein J7M28_07660 [bacterium]|nr:hypothetical protein [bacterium]
MRRHTTILLSTGIIATLAILAFAGYFTSEGWVYPTSGPADMQLFKYEIHYSLAEEQDAPYAYVRIWDGEDLIHYEMMVVTTLDRVAYYTYQTGLDEGDDYSFQFETVDDITPVAFGPDVW